MVELHAPEVPRASLGRGGRRPTILGLGGAPLGELFERLPEEQADAVVACALELGIGFFDTAPWYGRGLSELRVGRSLRQIERSKVVLSTKVGRVFSRAKDLTKFSSAPWIGGLPFTHRFDYSAGGLERSYEDSLLRLGLARVDYLIIHDLDRRHHSPDELEHHRLNLERDGWGFLEHLREAGEIGAIGAGINDAHMMSYFLERLDIDFFLVAMPYTLLDQTPLHQEFRVCNERGIQIVIGSPYASGILATGPIAGALYNYAEAPPAIVEKTSRLSSICKQFETPLQAAALQFPLAHPAVAAVIPGATSAEIVQRNVLNLRFRIPADLWRELKKQGLIAEDAPVPAATAW